MQKHFPSSAYVEVRFDDSEKRVITESDKSYDVDPFGLDVMQGLSGIL